MRSPPHGQFLNIPLANGNSHHSRNVSSVSGLRLTTTREESTRQQLQKERLSDEHHAIVVSQSVPGVKTSVAFFASLRTNLRLNASPPPSPLPTPPSMRASTSSLPPPSPLSSVMDLALEQAEVPTQDDPLEGVPELNTYVASDDEDKVSAMKLVADSVAQMRQTANSVLIFHWLNLTVIIAVLSLIARMMYDRKYDISAIGTTCVGVTMAILAICRYATQGYIAAAEEINWAWLGDAEVIVTKFGDEVVGAAVINWAPSDSKQRRKKSWRGEVKGWTVRLRYRRKGVGSALLEEAVKESKKKGAEAIEFADDHANSGRILPSIYNGKFDKMERKARERLQDLVESSPSRNRRKRGGST